MGRARGRWVSVAVAVLVVAGATACTPSPPEAITCARVTGQVFIESNRVSGVHYWGGPLTLSGCSGNTALTDGRFDITLPWSAATPTLGHTVLTFDGTLIWPDATTSTSKLVISYDDATATPTACPPPPLTGYSVSNCKHQPVTGSWAVGPGRFANPTPAPVSGAATSYVVSASGIPSVYGFFDLDLGPVTFTAS